MAQQHIENIRQRKRDSHMPMDFYCAFGMKERSEGELNYDNLCRFVCVCAQQKQTSCTHPYTGDFHVTQHAYIEGRNSLNGFSHLRGAFTEAQGKYWRIFHVHGQKNPFDYLPAISTIFWLFIWKWFSINTFPTNQMNQTRINRKSFIIKILLQGFLFIVQSFRILRRNGWV